MTAAAPAQARARETPEPDVTAMVRTSLPLRASTRTTEAICEAVRSAGAALSAAKAGSSQQPSIKQKRMSLF
jgi:hypothetical protein